MSGFDNEVLYSIGERLEPSTAQARTLMQKTVNDVSIFNFTGNPEGVVAANPSSTSHDPVSGNIYQKYTGTGTTGWVLINPKPNQVLDLFDDFITSSAGNNDFGNLLWFCSGIGFGTGTADHPGIVVCPNPSFPTSISWLTLKQLMNSSDIAPFSLGGGVFSLNYVAKLTALSNSTNAYEMYFGLFNSAGGISGPVFPPTNGVFFKYTHSVNSGNWQVIAISANVATTTNTTVPADTNWHNFGIVINAAGTSVSFTIDGVSVGIVASNIPLTPISPTIYCNVVSGNSGGFQLDLFYARLVLTNAR